MMKIGFLKKMPKGSTEVGFTITKKLKKPVWITFYINFKPCFYGKIIQKKADRKINN